MKNISRRDFLKTSTLASSLVFVPEFLHGLGQNNNLAAMADSNGKRLVVIQLSGGNDGLNTVIPYRNDEYYRLRPTLGINQSQILTLEKDLGFNPALEKLKSLFDKGEVAVLNGVGYPNPDRSHFRSMDIWHTGSASSEYLSSGWLGRYLDANCHNSHSAIELDDTLSLAMKGEVQKALALRDPKKFFNAAEDSMVRKLSQVNSAGSQELDYLYKTLAETTSSAKYIYQKSKIYKSALSYPNTEFARNLKTTAELICSGVESRVSYVSLSGFDTHVRQQEQQGRLLKELAEGVEAITSDLKQKDEFKNTLIFVFSEFGRRVKQNASNGTDHGTANNVFLIGGGLKKTGIINEAPDLLNLTEGDLQHQLDFRQIYATLLNNWLNADDKRILGKDFERLKGLV